MKRYLSSFFSFLKIKKFPSGEDLTNLSNSPFSILKLVVVIVGIFCIGIFLNLLLTLSNKLTIEVPDYGGEISHALIGSPRFINPLLATSQSDLAISQVVFAPLIKLDSTGQITPLLAKDCLEDKNKKSVECTLQDGLVFSDNTPLTTSDVLFSFATKKDLSLRKDPLGSWANISFELVSGNTISFSTKGSLEDLKQKMTLGIVPKALWENVPIDSLEDSYLNTKPVGAGAFKLSHISYKNSLPSEVSLSPNKHFVGKKPFLKNLNFKIYTNQLTLLSAIKNSEVDSSYSLNSTLIDEGIRSDFDIKTISSTNDIALWVAKDQTQTPSAQKLAFISSSVDRNRIIDNIENGYGIPLFSKDSSRSSDLASKINISTPIPIAVQKDDGLIKTAQILSEILESFGIMTTVQVFDQGLFVDQVQQGKYSFILASSQDVTGGYQHLIPLYTKPFVQISSKGIGVVSPQKLSFGEELLADTQLWYARTDKVWKWFINK